MCPLSRVHRPRAQAGDGDNSFTGEAASHTKGVRRMPRLKLLRGLLKYRIRSRARTDGPNVCLIPPARSIRLELRSISVMRRPACTVSPCDRCAWTPRPNAHYSFSTCSQALSARVFASSAFPEFRFLARTRVEKGEVIMICSHSLLSLRSQCCCSLGSQCLTPRPLTAHESLAPRADVSRQPTERNTRVGPAGPPRPAPRRNALEPEAHVTGCVVLNSRLRLS
mmetsp:Transcript_19156/g.56388  ORF Transcript_19156/g.56388 Transcript_19156/m.56388 type:complete len:224 (-) Transcript_19156:15-686(-)